MKNVYLLILPLIFNKKVQKIDNVNVNVVTFI